VSIGVYRRAGNGAAKARAARNKNSRAGLAAARREKWICASLLARKTLGDPAKMLELEIYSAALRRAG
jgi:hypothetical protein